jgi:hypothetical protein
MDGERGEDGRKPMVEGGLASQREREEGNWPFLGPLVGHWDDTGKFAPLKHRSTSTRLHGTILQKAVIFILTAVRT